MDLEQDKQQDLEQDLALSLLWGGYCMGTLNKTGSGLEPPLGWLLTAWGPWTRPGLEPSLGWSLHRDLEQDLVLSLLWDGHCTGTLNKTWFWASSGMVTAQGPWTRSSLFTVDWWLVFRWQCIVNLKQHEFLILLLSCDQCSSTLSDLTLSSIWQLLIDLSDLRFHGCWITGRI